MEKDVSCSSIFWTPGDTESSFQSNQICSGAAGHPEILLHIHCEHNERPK